MQKLKLALPAMSKPKERKVKDTTASVWNNDWVYVPAGETDLSKKFRRIRREQALDQAKAMRRVK
jgi:hypothetical protein